MLRSPCSMFPLRSVGPALLRAACAVLLGMTLVSCAMGPRTRDRLSDLGQVFDATLTAGPGVEISARATSLAQFGGGAFDGRSLGWKQGRWIDVHEQRGEFGLSLVHFYQYRRNGHGQVLDVHHPRWADPGYTAYPWSFRTLTDRRASDVGLTFHLLYLGVDLAFHPAELLDFVGGLFGRDPAGDDAFSSTAEERMAGAHALDARTRAAAFDRFLRRGESTLGYAIYTMPDVRPPVQREAIEALTEPPSIQ